MMNYKNEFQISIRILEVTSQENGLEAVIRENDEENVQEWR